MNGRAAGKAIPLTSCYVNGPFKPVAVWPANDALAAANPLISDLPSPDVTLFRLDYTPLT